MNQVPEDGFNPYANHPGFDAVGCYLQYTVTQRGPWGNISSAGFGCEATGGHCLPGSQCEKRKMRYPVSVKEQRG